LRKEVIGNAKGNKWTRLGTEIGPALAAYAKLFDQKRTDGGLSLLLRRVLTHLASTISAGSLSQYKSAATKLEHVFADFSPEQIRPLHVKRLKREMLDNPGGFNTCLTVLRQVME
jgi:hypothetical protein